MKRRWVFGLLALAFAACSRVSEQTDAVPPAAAAKATGSVPSEAEIAAFLPFWQDPSDKHKSIRLDATFGVPPFRPQVMEEFRERGKVPFAVSVSLAWYEVEPQDGRSGPFTQGTDVSVMQMTDVSVIMDGKADIAVLDADGNLVDRQRKDLSLLCPS